MGLVFSDKELITKHYWCTVPYSSRGKPPRRRCSPAGGAEVGGV